MTPLILSLGFLAIAIGLLIADLFLPSAGVIFVISVLCAFASILFAFRHDYEFGIWLLIFELACVPIFTLLFIKLWPRTPLGRRMIIEPTEVKGFEWEEKSLIGQSGIALCDLVPNGDVEIGGKSWQATSRVGIISKGGEVSVVDEEMGLLFVVPAINKPKTSTATQESNSASDSMLNRPADELGLDSL